MSFQRPALFLTTLALAGAIVGTITLNYRPAHADGNTRPAAYTPKPKGTLTYTKDIAPILYANCVSCHRTGEIAPFALLTYQDAKKRAGQIATVTQSRYMPPWHAESHGEFVDEHKLTADQIAIIRQWTAEGTIEGKAGDLPPAPKFPQGWSLGKPDMVLEMSKSYTMKAEGGDVYRCFVMPTGATEDRYVAAVEVHPGNTKVVHHVIAYLDASNKARQMEAANKDGQGGYSSYGGIGVMPSGSLGGWAPGNLPHMLPDGIGMLLPKGADVVLQVHYHSTGKPETDQTKIGIYFCKKPVDKRLRVTLALAPLHITPGDANYRTQGNSIVPFSHDVTIVEVMPHMHLLGREMNLTAVRPDKTTRPLINVPDWDFNWQMTYRYKEPIKLPSGSTVAITARYDNSTGNPRNPSSPPKLVTWGEQTTDEMCIGFVFYTIDAEQLTKGIKVEDFLDRVSKLGGGAGRVGGKRANP